MKRIIRTLIWTKVVAITFCSSSLFAQRVEQSSLYVSPIDESVTIKKITLLPFTDNLGGIYARPVEQHILEDLRKKHRFDFIEYASAGELPTFQEMMEEPERVKTLLQPLPIEAALSGRLYRGPAGVQIEFVLFMKGDGLPFLQIQEKDLKTFDVNSLKTESQKLLDQLIKRVPYDGLVLSRQNNRVTINLGTRDGIENNQVLSAVQIIKLERHPKFHFLIRTEKEILGKIRILKVDDTLSFGKIITEKEKGSISRNTKIAGSDFVSYGDGGSLSEGDAEGGYPPEDKISFGENPQEWKPQAPPSFGQVGIRLGLGTFSSSLNVPNVSNMNAESSISPSVILEGELWLTSRFTVAAYLKQGIISADNPREGSSPDELAFSLSAYRLLFGYNFMSGEDFWGPKAEVQIGFAKYRMFVDDSSPRALTTMDYSGFVLGLKGSLPITEDRKWSAGAGFFFSYKPHLDESPQTSGGSPENSMNIFSVFLQRKIRENIRATGSLDFEMYSTNFSGPGSRGAAEEATSSSQKHIVLSGGVYYLF